MRASRVAAIVLISMVSLVSCRRDPATAKKHYFESGNRYFDKDLYKQASIQYSNAIKMDAKYGPAYYKRALSYLKYRPTPLFVPAIKDFRRSISLLEDNAAYKTEYLDSMVKVSEIFLAYTNEKPILEEVQGYVNYLLGITKHPKEPMEKPTPPIRGVKDDDGKQEQLYQDQLNAYQNLYYPTPIAPLDPFDGYRLQGDLDFKRAGGAYSVSNKEGARSYVDKALEEYRKADQAKPGDDGVTMQMARALELGGKESFPEAERLLRQILAHDKTKAAAYQELYNLFMFQGKATDAEQVLRTAVENNPKQYTYLELLAQHYGRQGDRENMGAVLEKIKSHASEWDQAYMKVGDFYLRTGDLESALREYRNGMAKDQKNKANYQKHIIEVLMRQGKKGEAAMVADEILKTDKNDPDARGLQATLLLDRGDISKALTELQAVVTRAPDNPVARFQLARAHAARNEIAQARLQFQKAIELRPDYMVARLALTQLELNTKNYDAAYKAADEVLQKFDRNNVAAQIMQSAALAGMQKFAESHALLGTLLKNSPNSPDVHYQIGRTSLSEGKYKEAEDSFRRSYELDPNGKGLLGIVEADMAQKKSDAAIKLLEDEAKKFPNRPDLLLDLGDVARISGRFDLAVSTYQKVMDNLDKDAKQRGDIFARIGETYRFKGDLNSAVDNYQKARQFMPDNEVIVASLALVLDQAGERKKAMGIYEASVKLNPNNAVAMNNLAFLMAETGGDLNQAISYAQKAKQLLPNIPEISDTLGWIYLKMGNPDSAVGIFKDLVDHYPKMSTYRYHLGMAYDMRGDHSKALTELNEALKDAPSQIEEKQIRDKLKTLGNGLP